MRSLARSPSSTSDTGKSSRRESRQGDCHPAQGNQPTAAAPSACIGHVRKAETFGHRVIGDVALVHVDGADDSRVPLGCRW